MPGGKFAVYKNVKNKKYKLCKGPLHPDGKFVALDEYWIQQSGGKYRIGKPRSWCKSCEMFHRSPNYEENQLVDYKHYKLFLINVVNRLGQAEAARRLEISYSLFYQVYVVESHTKITKKFAKKIVYLLAELVRSGEVRHKKSIKHGSYLRGRKERVPLKAKDFYHGGSDRDNEQRRERAKRQAKGKDA